MKGTTSRDALKRSQQACTSCRQAKARCDGLENFPAACSRCKKKTLECRTDPSFKRVRTRYRLEEVTNQLNAIQRSLGIRPSSSSTEPEEGSSSNDLLSSHQPISPAISEKNYSNTELNGYDFYQTSHTEHLRDSSFSLGEITLDSRQVTDLFQHFKHQYYRHCPVLECSIPVADLYLHSPFLFWTITIISIRAHPSLSFLYHKIEDPYKALLGTVLTSPILELSRLQGISLLCFWPLPVEKQIYDITWNLCGILTNSALQMGLHNSGRGENVNMNRPERDRRIRSNIWMACIQINASYSWNHGLAVSAELTQKVAFLHNPSTLELDFQLKTVLQQQSAKSAMVMASITSTMNDLQFAQGICRGLENLKVVHSEAWSDETEIVLLVSQIKVYAFQLQKTLGRGQKVLIGVNMSPDLDVSVKVMLHCGFTAAVRLVHTFSELLTVPKTDPSISNSEPGIDNQFLQRYLPKHYYNSLFNACAFIFKWMAIYAAENSSLDGGIARSHIQLTHKILSSISMSPMDEADRTARVIERLSRKRDLSRLNTIEQEPDQESRLHLLQDVVNTADEIRKESSKREGNSNGEPAQENLPQSPFQDAFQVGTSQYTGSSRIQEELNNEFALDFMHDFDWDGFGESMGEYPLFGA